MPITITAMDRKTAGFINLTKLKWVSDLMICMEFSSITTGDGLHRGGPPGPFLNADPLDFAIPDEVVEDDPRDKNRGEHTDHNADR